MCSGTIGSTLERVSNGLDTLAAADLTRLSDQQLRDQLLELVTISHRTHAELARRVDAFDRRGLAAPDGFRTTKAWLQGFGRLSGAVAHRLVKAARLLRWLPKLADATQTGEVSPEHVRHTSRLADQVGADQVARADAILADAARSLDAAQFATVCARIQAHLDPDGPDPDQDFARRSLTLSPLHGSMLLRGQLDAEGGAALATALDAMMSPPTEEDSRTAGQRRADALVELARRALTSGTLPTVGGQRPQVGVLLFPQALSPKTLATLAELHRDDAAGPRLQRWLAATYPDGPPAAGETTDQPAAPAAHAHPGNPTSDTNGPINLTGNATSSINNGPDRHTTHAAPAPNTATHAAPASNTATHAAPASNTATHAAPASNTATYAGSAWDMAAYAAPASNTATHAAPASNTAAYAGSAWDMAAYAGSVSAEVTGLPPPGEQTGPKPGGGRAGPEPAPGGRPPGQMQSATTQPGSPDNPGSSGDRRSPDHASAMQGHSQAYEPNRSDATQGADTTGPADDPNSGPRAVLRPTWSRTGWADPPWLNWLGPISPVLAQRIACDADIWRVIIDPHTGMPLDVGRAHRLVPYWIRKALYARDRGCCWPGCQVPAEWTDAHHLDPWAEGGETEIERCCLLCRWHHRLVHEGGWSIDLEPDTGEVTIARPGGIPYRIPRTRSTAWTGPTS